MIRDDWAVAVNWIAEAVNHAALERAADRDAHRRTGGNDFAAGMNAVQFAERHQEQMMIPKTDHFREHVRLAARRLDAHDFAQSGERTFRFHDPPATVAGGSRAL